MEQTLDFDCPVCGTSQWLELDTRSVGEHDFTHDCAICCNPIAVTVHLDGEGRSWCEVRPE